MLQLADKSRCLSVMGLFIASHLRYPIKYLVLFMTVFHTYFYIVVDTQRGCHTLTFLCLCPLVAIWKSRNMVHILVNKKILSENVFVGLFVLSCITLSCIS